MASPNYSFKKTERLCSHNVIEALFTTGSSFVCYPFRVVYMQTELPDDIQSQVMFSVSKKRFKRAVHRNLIKRRSKEAYRLHRHKFTSFLKEEHQQIAFAMVYLPSDQLPFTAIEKGIKKALIKLEGALSTINKNEASV
jgi:ribonuclease P protein component